MNGSKFRRDVASVPERFLRPVARDLRRRLPSTAMRPGKATAARVLGGGLSTAVGIGALALGALAIGALAINRLAIRRGRIGSLSVGTLEVDRLIVKQRIDAVDTQDDAAASRPKPAKRQSGKGRPPPGR